MRRVGLFCLGGTAIGMADGVMHQPYLLSIALAALWAATIVLVSPKGTP